MASVRKVGGKWKATVTLPTGKQTSRTDPYKAVVTGWAREVEAEIRRARWHDPRPARSMTLSAWRDEWLKGRVVEVSTTVKDAAQWRQRIEARWGETSLGAITRTDLQQWVAALVEEGTGAHTVHATMNHLGAMLQSAVESDPPLLQANPARGLDLPRLDAGRLRFFTEAEAARVAAQLEEPYRLLVEVGCYCGLRWGELAGLDAVAVSAGASTVRVQQVLTRQGLRPYAKSSMSHRTVPVPPHLRERLQAAAAGGGLVFSGARGGPLHEGNFRRRIWEPALSRAGVDYAVPHTMRHTAASWLVQAGVDLYRVQAHLGHDSYTTTLKYAHLAPDAHKSVLDAWASTVSDQGQHQDSGGDSNDQTWVEVADDNRLDPAGVAS